MDDQTAARYADAALAARGAALGAQEDATDARGDLLDNGPQTLENARQQLARARAGAAEARIQAAIAKAYHLELQEAVAQPGATSAVQSAAQWADTAWGSADTSAYLAGTDVRELQQMVDEWESYRP